MTTLGRPKSDPSAKPQLGLIMRSMSVAPADPESPSRRSLPVWITTGLGVGLISPAPGTVGSLWGLPLTVGLWQLDSLLPPGMGPLARWTLIGLLIAVGVPLCTVAARHLGGQKDPQAIVIDEYTTIPLVFLFVAPSTWWILLLGFGCHRLFDISKPWPCKWLEKLPDGLGVMADDCVAALYGAATLWGIVWLLGRLA